MIPVFLGGVAGGLLQSLVVSPFELIKVQQQTAGGTTVEVMRRLSTQWRNATRGLGATFWRDGIPHGV